MSRSSESYPKCSIKSLLSESQAEGNLGDLAFENIKDLLKESSMLSSLDTKALCSKITACETQINWFANEGDIHSRELELIKGGEDLLKSEIYLSEKVFLQNTIKEFAQSTNMFKFRIVTQRMMRQDSNKLFKRRLERRKVNILEEWYTTHLEKPLLNDGMLRTLMNSTGLTKGQIRNW